MAGGGGDYWDHGLNRASSQNCFQREEEEEEGGNKPAARWTTWEGGRRDEPGLGAIRGIWEQLSRPCAPQKGGEGKERSPTGTHGLILTPRKMMGREGV